MSHRSLEDLLATAESPVELLRNSQTGANVFPGVPPEFAIDRAWTAAFVLIMLVMGLNIVARLISRFFAPKTGR